MRKSLTAIKGEHFAITGTSWISRPKLRTLLRKRGGLSAEGGPVTGATTVLVRGNSSFWKFREFGKKELDVARRIRIGQPIVVVHDYELRRLLEKGTPARAIDRVAVEPIQWLVRPSKQKFAQVASKKG